MKSYAPATFILRYRLPLLLCIGVVSLILFVLAPKVKKSYNYINAIPQDSKAAHNYHFLKTTFHNQGTYIVVGVQSPHFFEPSFFSAYQQLVHNLNHIPGVQHTFSVAQSVYLEKNETHHQFIARPIFDSRHRSLKASEKLFRSIPLYRNMVYNDSAHAYLLLVNIDEATAFSHKRDTLVANIDAAIARFQTQVQPPIIAVSGMSYIRTKIADILSYEMTLLILVSVSFLILIIGITFRFWAYLLTTFIILLLGIVYVFGTLVLLEYEITLLTSIVPTLMIIIGVPNCVYFFHKYEQALKEGHAKHIAISLMLQSMGRVTLFCNITSALGFFVFLFTTSTLLHDFSIIASLNILLLFAISYILIPILLSYFPQPKRTLHSASSKGFLNGRSLQKIFTLPIIYRKSQWIISIMLFLLVFSIIGISRLQTNSFVVDDLPHRNKIRQDISFFERNFQGILPLDLLIDTRKKKGATSNLDFLHKIDKFTEEAKVFPTLSKGLSLSEGLKLMHQFYYDGDSTFYSLPTPLDISFIAPYLKSKQMKNIPNALLQNFTDSNQQILRLNYRIADMGHKAMQVFLDTLHHRLTQYIDTSKNTLYFTGDTVAFLAGNQYLIAGLKESILWEALFLMLILCYLFRSIPMVIIGILPNILPILLSLGLLGYMEVPIKPSLVIIFSIILGIAIDITIRLMVLYKTHYVRLGNATKSIEATLNETRTSIIYTTLILMGGFFIFIISQFESLRYFGIITSFTLLTATLSNFLFLPLLLRYFHKTDKKK